MQKRGREKKRGLFGRLFRSLFSIVILSAFVIAIALLVKQMSSFNSIAVSKYTSPVLNKLGFSGDAAGVVAGEFVERLAHTKINSQQNKELPQVAAVQTEKTSSDRKSERLFSVALIADSGDENDMLEKAINKAEEAGVDYIVHMGDATAWGDIKSLEAAKSVLNSASVEWYIIPGDHDLADSVGADNFIQVFGETNSMFEVQGKTFLLLDNSANFTPISEESLNWQLSNIKKSDFVIMSQPIYHPVNPRVMGVFDGKIDKKVKSQAEVLLEAVRDSKVEAIFAADHHKSSENKDPVRNSLTHHVVGSVATQRNLQRPRFSILHVYATGDYGVEEVILE